MVLAIARELAYVRDVAPVTNPVGMNVQTENTTPDLHNPTFRKPNVHDASAVWKLIQDTGVLDLNSSYCYLMLSHYFNDTCMLVENQDNDVVGFASAFLVPKRPDTLFVWQVAVSETARGHGIGTAMLQNLLRRPMCRDVRHLETTVTADNLASEAMFRRLAKSLRTNLDIKTGFTEDLFPGNGHEHERLIVIGPLHPAALAKRSSQSEIIH